ncbi:MAG: acetylxylan esterase [Verrucomicrobiales bacterium]|nr:acetylxylan esterase [Verrucomicrobiales bacterium]
MTTPLPRPTLSVAIAALSLLTGGLTATVSAAGFADLPGAPTAGDRMLAEYFETETRRLATRSLANIESKEDWEKARDGYRRQLFEMLGLQPLPERTPLEAQITGKTELEDIVVENVLFESRPGLYVTGNFYRPKSQDGPLPAILYVCGHGGVKIDGVSYGNKTHYQHHGAWFARNGYVCLIIDTLQLGEIEGIHHGTHNKGRFWWNARGYTSAGVEAWNCIRALDYLETRPEADKTKFGVTGRSGGGAYSWWVAALDERIQAAVPVAGITNLQNHVVDGCVEGHCDCMYHVNTYRWDFPMIAALVAPRALLIGNTDKDRIFPLDGVVDVYQRTHRIYELLGAGDKVGIALYEGGHNDTQPIRVPAFHWFERHLKGKEISHEMADTTAPKPFDPKQLKVLTTIPEDERNTVIDEYFTRRFPTKAKAPASEADWGALRDQWLERLKTKCFRAWPAKPEEIVTASGAAVTREGLSFAAYDFISQDNILLRLYLVHREGLKPADLDLTVLNVLDEDTWKEFLASTGAAFPEGFEGVELPALDREAFDQEKKMYASQKWAMAYIAPRGVGATAWTDDEKERTQIRRRFQLLGMTQDSARVWDIRRGIQALRSVEGFEKGQLWLQSHGDMAANTLYASLFEPDIHRLDLHELPGSHMTGPDYLNVLRFLDIPQAAAMAAERSRLVIYAEDETPWAYPKSVGQLLKWDEKKLQVRAPVHGGENP